MTYTQTIPINIAAIAEKQQTVLIIFMFQIFLHIVYSEIFIRRIRYLV